MIFLFAGERIQNLFSFSFLGGELVEVDESLFEDILDLDLEESAGIGIDLSDVDV